MKGKVTSGPELEFQLQLCLVDFLLDAYPNVIFRSDLGGIRLPPGLAKKVKKLSVGSKGQGEKVPYPDFFIAEPRGGWSGLYIELKRLSKFYTNGSYGFRVLKDDKHIREQAVVLARLRNKGFYADFAGGRGEIFHLAKWYLSLTCDNKPYWPFSIFKGGRNV